MALLTMRRLNAIREALGARLAGEIADSGSDRRDYEQALEWANEQLRRRGEKRGLSQD